MALLVTPLAAVNNFDELFMGVTEFNSPTETKINVEEIRFTAVQDFGGVVDFSINSYKQQSGFFYNNHNFVNEIYLLVRIKNGMEELLTFGNPPVLLL